MSAYRPPVSIRKLFAILIALAVLLAPGVSGAAMAAAQQHDMQMMEAGHCEAPPAKSADHDKMAGKSCCMAMCMAVAVAPSAPGAKQVVAHVQATFPAPKSYVGHLSEIATPPPRLA